MKKVWLRICSLVLIVVMTVNTLPLNVFAEQYQSIKSTSTNASVSKPSDVYIVGEHVDSRSEFSKNFLLNNGLSLAVVYNSAVHYEKNGKWEEIDNTLQIKSNGTFINKSGLWNVAFPQQMSSSNQISISKDGYTLSFGMAGELRQQDNLEIMSVEELTPKEIVADIVVPETVVPETTTPETTAPETTVSETTEPETIEPETTVSETTGSETTEPETTVSNTTEPETTVSETTAFDTTEPETTVSETTVSETTVFDTTEPETIEPETTEPETTEPKASIFNNSSLGATTQTVSVTVDGTAQTFAVNSAKTVQG